MQKRVAAIHDISCFGRCSLTVALPILSAAGIATSIIPTAVLSTHTGGFEGYTFRDLTEDIIPVAKHWKSLDLWFEAIYTGYLGSYAQLTMVSEIFAMFRETDTLILVDPVMGDNGKLYTAFDESFPKGMVELCAKADVIVPNITEAALLLGEDYKEGPYTREYIEGLLSRLSSTGVKKIVLTGVYLEEGHMGAAAYDCNTKSVSYYFREKIPGMYHGTGDVFSSVLLSGLLCNQSIEQSMKLAVDFTTDAILRTYNDKTDTRYGVNFEQGLSEFGNLCLNNNNC